MADNIDEPGKIELLCIGNAMVDVFAPADFARLDGLGITEPVQHVPLENAARMLDELRSGDLVLASGGAVANVAKIASMLGVGSAFAGCVGGDDLAAFFEEELISADVVPFITSVEGGTGICLVFEASGETRIAASPGAALEFTEADVPGDLIARADAVVLDGYMLDRRPLVQRILQLANRHGIPIALDAASVFHIKEKTEAILHYSRNYPLIVFMNADESIVFYNTIRKGGVVDEFANEREKEAFILREICPVLKCMTEGDIFPVIVIKLGGRGAVVLAGGGIHRAGTFSIIPRNTVGAGDAFCAAFMSAWIRGKPIRDCASLGNKVAREVLMVPGTSVKKEKLSSLSRLLR
ncbi:MAG: PfkB family carbohydrate kinase [Treponema sp.]|nr:PfkB family carbohydrate kinase [Treponema sp.]